MSLDKTFESLVEARDIVRVRKALIRTLVMQYEDFEEYRQYAERQLSGLYNVHDGWIPDMPDDPKDEDFDETRARLLENFSRERLNFMKEICRRLYGPKKAKRRSGSSDHARETRYESHDSDKLFWILIAAIICGGGMLAYVLMWLTRR